MKVKDTVLGTKKEVKRRNERYTDVVLGQGLYMTNDKDGCA